MHGLQQSAIGVGTNQTMNYQCESLMLLRKHTTTKIKRDRFCVLRLNFRNQKRTCVRRFEKPIAASFGIIDFSSAGRWLTPTTWMGLPF